MKSSLNAIFAVAIVALIGFEYWQYRHNQAETQRLEQQLVALQQSVDALSQQLNSAKEEDAASSLGNLLEEANKALVDGWSVMVDAVERELQRAQQQIEESKKPKSEAPTETPQSHYGPGAL
ncbi:MAG: hypothetical protein VYE54_11875 [Pseudomonadota bacterium]|nr:hypothetical protein [Pseudomonadota bacterium]